MRALEEVFAQTMSRDMGFDYSGMSFQEQVASQGVPASAVIGFSVLVVFLLMAALYESWTLPFAVLLATPIAMFGALGALWLRGFELDVFSQIDRKSTRLNSSHGYISYAVFCLKKKKTLNTHSRPTTDNPINSLSASRA